MKMVTIPILVMNTFNVNRTKTVVFICMHCTISYVQQEAKCIAVHVRKENNFFSFESFVILMHFETALEETQS